MKLSLYLTGIIILSLAIISCGGDTGSKGESASSAEMNGNITFVFTGNIGGIINPCGCRIPLGGIGRRATVIREIKADADNVLVFDSGAMLFTSQYLYEPYDVIGQKTSTFIAELVNDIGINALNVASYDLSNGPDSLMDFDKLYESKWISSNVVRRGSEETLFAHGDTYTSGEFTVGVFGFMDDKPKGVPIFRDDAPVDVLDPYESAKKEVAKLKGKVDIIVALAYMDIDGVKRIAEENPEINVIVMSHTRQHNPSSEHKDFQPEVVGNTLIVRSPDGGRVVGRLDLNVVKGSYEFTDESNYVDLRPESVRAQDPTPVTSTFKHEFIDLGPDIEHDPAVVTKIKAFSTDLLEYTKSIDLDYKIR